jgi:hypothetical protein
VARPLSICSRASKASNSSNTRTTKATKTAIDALKRLYAALDVQQTELEGRFGDHFNLNRSVRDVTACPEYRDGGPSFAQANAETKKARAEAHVAMYKVFKLGISQTDFGTAASEALSTHGASWDYNDFKRYMYIDNSPVTKGEERSAKVRLGWKGLKSKLPWAE